MRTAVDTNILVDLLNESAFTAASIAALRSAASLGDLVVCDVVYAEICVMFERREECDYFLKSLTVSVEPLDPESSFQASRSWISYLGSGGGRVRILPDSLIAGHATHQANQLLTRDGGFLKKHFEDLMVVSP